ncbi:MAG: DUF3106 domain-containing protein [Planctomycetales bacterium]|nr:DUF3106 domain-containing protein [Planctomycetales bacterium]
MRLATLALVIAAAGPVFAQQVPPAAAPDAARAAAVARWKSLPEAERARLFERYKAWKALPEGEREKLKKNLERFQDLTLEERRKLREFKKRFEALAPEPKAFLLANARKLRELPIEKQRHVLEGAEALSALPSEERTEILSLAAPRRDARVREIVARHRLAMDARKLSPEERKALASLPFAEQREKVKEILRARREAQMRRLAPADRKALDEMPPGTERERKTRALFEELGRLERLGAAVLMPQERASLAPLSLEEKSARLREMAPALRRRAIQRLPEAERARLEALPPEEQERAVREIMATKALERLRPLLRPEQASFLESLPLDRKADWAREFVEENREGFAATLTPADRAELERQPARVRDRRLREWIAGKAVTPAPPGPESDEQDRR